MPSQEVLLGTVGERPGGQDRDAVADFPVEHLGPHLDTGPEHPGHARVVHHHGLLPHLNTFVPCRSLDEIGDVGLDVFSLEGPANLLRHPAEFPGAFHQVHFIAQIRESQGCRHPGNTAPHHQDIFVHRQSQVGQRAGETHRRRRPCA